jgi:hypothetical protein
MTLRVCACRIGPNGECAESLDAQLPEPRNELFGFEVCRHELWGAPIVRELGCGLLASLADGDVYAADEAVLAQLEGEARHLLAHLADVEGATGYEAEFVQFRLDNLLAVVAYARSAPTGTVGVNIG